MESHDTDTDTDTDTVERQGAHKTLPKRQRENNIKEDSASNSPTDTDVDSLLDDLQARLLAGSSASSSPATPRPDPEELPVLRSKFRLLCQHQLHTGAQLRRQSSPTQTARHADTKSSASTAPPASYEDRVWQVVFRRVIDPLRAKLSRRQGDTSKTAAARLDLLTALYDAMGYFHSIIGVLRGHTALSADMGLVFRFGYLAPAESARVISLHRCLTYLGDLERYHHQATHALDLSDPHLAPSLPFPATAYTRYLTALALYPSGKACSQLGTLVSTYYHASIASSAASAPSNDTDQTQLPLVAMYWFARGLAMRQPSSVCRDNLEVLCTQLHQSPPPGSLVAHLLLHALAPTLSLALVPLPTTCVSTAHLLSALGLPLPPHHLAQLVLVLLTHLLPKYAPASDPDLVGHHVRRGVLLAVALGAAGACPRARLVLATWAVGQPGVVSEVVRTSVAVEVQARLGAVVDLRDVAGRVLAKLPLAVQEEAVGDSGEFVWVDEVDRDLCQFACLDDMYVLLDPFKSPAASFGGNGEGGDRARLVRLASILEEHFDRPTSSMPPTLAAKKGGTAAAATAAGGLRLIATASGPKLKQELVPSVLVLACDVVQGESVKSPAWREVRRVMDLQVCRIVVPTYVIEYLDEAKTMRPLARHVVRTLEAITRQQGGDGIVRIQTHASDSLPTLRSRTVDDDETDATFAELRCLQSCLDDILSREPEDMPHIVVVTNNRELTQAFEAAAVQCVRPASLSKFVRKEIESRKDH